MIKAIRFFFFMTAAVAAGLSIGPVHASIRDGFPGDEAAFKVFRLTQTWAESEIDRPFLENMDSVTPPFPAGSPYQIGDIPVISGQRTVYKFVAAYRGVSAEGEKDFHDLLVIETDASGTILDGYHYTLEWTDKPTLDLFRVSAKGVLLRDGLKISELALANVQTGSALGEEGVISLHK